jgi:ribosomal protein S18 acetylase RimI-like enzyme
MIQVRTAIPEDAKGIIRVCSDGWRETYVGIYPQDYIERVIREYYNFDRVRGEISDPKGWDGWLVAIDSDIIVGAGGGGMVSEKEGEVFVLYLDPKRRGEGIGTLLLNAITEQQKKHGATEQWVSVGKENQKGIPFYLARGFIEKGERSGWETRADESYISLRMWRRI